MHHYCCWSYQSYRHLTFQPIAETQATTRTAVNNGPKHIEHLMSTLLADDFIHTWLELSNDISFVVLNFSNEHMGSTDAVVGKGGIGANHFAHRNLTRTKTQSHRRMDFRIANAVFM